MRTSKSTAVYSGCMLLVHCFGAVLEAHTIYAGAAIGLTVSNSVLRRTSATTVNLIMVQEVISGIALML